MQDKRTAWRNQIGILWAIASSSWHLRPFMLSKLWGNMREILHTRPERQCWDPTPQADARSRASYWKSAQVLLRSLGAGIWRLFCSVFRGLLVNMSLLFPQSALLCSNLCQYHRAEDFKKVCFFSSCLLSGITQSLIYWALHNWCIKLWLNAVQCV